MLRIIRKLSGITAGAVLILSLALPAKAQSSTPQGQPHAKTTATTAKKPNPKAAPAAQPRPSLSGELNAAQPRNAGGATLSNPSGSAAASNQDEIPLGPLHLELQGDTARQGSYGVAAPPGLGQYRSERVDPYIGLSIIELKR